MTWVRLDDGFCDHPKVALLPIKARWALLHGLCYANRYLTDGSVPTEVAHRWEGQAACQTLVQNGLWTKDGGAYWIVGYLDWNPSKAEVEAQREAAAERRKADSMRKRRARGADVHADSEGTNDRTGSGEEWSRKDKEEWFERFFAEYPRRVDRRHAEIAFERALKRGADPEAIIEGATRYAVNPSRDPNFTAYPATWLNGDRWLDETETRHPLAAVRQIDFEAEQAARMAEEDAAVAALMADEAATAAYDRRAD